MAAPWTNINPNRLDADSPVDEDLTGDVADNELHNFEHALRVGTFATGVRLALARGATAFDVNLDGSGNGESVDAVVFATDALDGDPNFDSAPTCLGIAFEELSTGSDINNPTSVTCRIQEGSLTASGFTVVTTVRGGNTTVLVDFNIHWAFVGPVTAGE